MDKHKPRVKVSINGQKRFFDVVEAGYVARFDVGEDSVKLEIDYDEAEDESD